MLITFRGNSPLIMLDYDGKRFVFEKGKPREATKEIYDYLINSGNIDPREIIIEKEPAPEPAKETIVEKAVKHITKKGNKKR